MQLTFILGEGIFAFDGRLDEVIELGAIVFNVFTLSSRPIGHHQVSLLSTAAAAAA